MKSTARIFLAGLVAALGFACAPKPAAATVCPAIGIDIDCGLVITLGPGGSNSIASTGEGPYDFDPSTGEADDTLVGVVNNSGKAVSAIGLSSAELIFAFDGDGICSAVGSPAFDTYPSQAYCGKSAYYTTNPGDYAGPNNTFAITDLSHGSVLFTTPLADGDSTYFSLEEFLSETDLAVTSVTLAPTPVPEPETPMLFAAALAGLFVARRGRGTSR